MVDTLDIITAAQARQALFRQSATEYDATNVDDLGNMITAVSRRVDELCGPVVQRTVTEHHRLSRPRPYRLFPYQTPVSSVTSVDEWDGTSGSTTTLTANSFGTAPASAGFRLVQLNSPHGDYIVRQSAGSDVRFQQPEVRLVYVAGRYADTASVGELWTNAVQSILRRMWDREQGAWARPVDPYGDPNAGSRFFNAIDHVVKEQLADEKRVA